LCAATSPGSRRSPTGPDFERLAIAILAGDLAARSRHELGHRELRSAGVALGEHIVLVTTALVLSLLIAFPLGIWTARRPALYVAAMTATGVLYTIPALAPSHCSSLHGIGQAAAITALVLYSLLILVRNIAIGIREVPRADRGRRRHGYGKGRGWSGSSCRWPCP